MQREIYSTCCIITQVICIKSANKCSEIFSHVFATQAELNVYKQVWLRGCQIGILYASQSWFK